MTTTNAQSILPMAATTTAPVPSKTLGRTVVGVTLVAVFVGMLAYTGFEYLFATPTDLAEFLTHHLFPALFIGLVVSLTLSVLIHSKVIAPVKKIFEHLYHVGSGRLAPLELDSRIEEIDTVVEGINLLVQRLKDNPDNQAIGKAADDVVKLRSDLKRAVNATASGADEFIPVMRDLQHLERHLLSAIEAAKQSA